MAQRPQFVVPSLADARRKLAESTASAPTSFDLHQQSLAKRPQASPAPADPTCMPPPRVSAASANPSSTNTNMSHPRVSAGPTATNAEQQHYLHRPLPPQPASLQAAFPQFAATVPLAPSAPPAASASSASTPKPLVAGSRSIQANAARQVSNICIVC
jgi:hypothetical protein